jgi:hypothetical protein
MDSSPFHRRICGKWCPECGRALVSVQPIATYRESQLQRTRLFVLGANRVLVKGRQRFGADFETPVDLVTLDPEFLVVRGRGPALKPGLVSLVVGLGTGVPFFTGIIEEGPLVFGLCAIAMTLTGVVLIAVSFRKLEMVRFRSAARPELVLLDVIRSGPDRERFDDFVAALRNQIRIARTGMRDEVEMKSRSSA